jgi:hypothetical protein
MPIPTDYTTLVTEVGNYMHRADLSAEIPTYIAYAEKRVGHDLRITPLVNQTTVTISAGGRSVALPTGYIGMVSAKVTGGARLNYITPDTLDQADSNANGLTVPVFYTLIGTSIYVSPSWTAGGTLTLNHFKQETALSGSNTTNWYILNVPHLLQYAALLEGASFTKDDEEAAKWKTYYEYARDRANDLYGVVDSYQRAMAMQAGKGKSLTPSV